ncbi:MAG: hypothetical protein QF903_10360 [Planctomycetota bacterium]|jgi:YHS domain-containing protein|nr:hypothetical protein [Planctomycetota bacterium]
MITHKLRLIAVLGLAFAGLSWAGLGAQDTGGGAFGTAGGGAKKAAQSDDATVIFDQLPLYPMKDCPVSGKPLRSKGDPVNMVVDGRLIRVCCGGCKKRVAAQKEAIIAQLDAAAVKAQKESWPLSICPISGGELGGEDDPPIDVVWGGRYVKLCCNKCAGMYAKAPAKARAKVETALRAKLRESYPGKVCPVSGETLGSMGEPVEALYGTHLVRFCCEGCVKSYRKDPKKYVAKVYADCK